MPINVFWQSRSLTRVRVFVIFNNGDEKNDSVFINFMLTSAANYKFVFDLSDMELGGALSII